MTTRGPTGQENLIHNSFDHVSGGGCGARQANDIGGKMSFVAV